MKGNWSVKKGVDINDIKSIDPALLLIKAYVVDFGIRNRLEVVFTSIINDRDGVPSVSTTHASGRAEDLRIVIWPISAIRKLQLELNEKFVTVGALSKDTHVPTVALYGDEKHLDHMHLQVRPNADISRIIKA